MYTVQVERECGCFRRAEMKSVATYESKDDALMQAQAMVEDMNTKFCKKHKFRVVENNDTFVVAMVQP